MSCLSTSCVCATLASRARRVACTHYHASARGAAKQQVVDALENTTENMEEENARLKSLLAATSTRADELQLRLDDAVKTRDEADAKAKAHYENVFLVNEWKQFNEAYQAFEAGIRQSNRERDDTRAELEALRRRLRESKHLPHLGIKFALTVDKESKGRMKALKLPTELVTYE